MKTVPEVALKDISTAAALWRTLIRRLKNCRGVNKDDGI